MVEPPENEVKADPPPLKKRTTKRGLARCLASTNASSEKSESESSTPSYDIYSSCVERLSSLKDIYPPRIPLNLKNEVNKDTKKVVPKEEVVPVANEAEDLPADDLDDVTIDTENSQSAPGVTLTSPSPPPVPPPPKIVKGAKRKRMQRGLKKAFQTLGSAKDELMIAKVVASDPIIIDESPQRRTDNIIVRVKHVADVHRFSMAKAEIFYKLQTQMAEILDVDVDQVGLYLRDDRLSPTDTPASTRLHLADIIECHILVPSDGHKGSGDSQEESEHTAKVLMQCPNSRDNVHLVVKKFLPFKDMMAEYAKLRGKPVHSFRFKLDGELLSPDSMPTDVDLDSGDTIDVIEVT